MTEHHYRRGDIIYRQGEAPVASYAIKEGWVELVDLFGGAARQLQAGEKFGEDNVRHGMPYDATAVAKTDIVLEVLSAGARQSLAQVSEVLDAALNDEVSANVPPVAATVAASEIPKQQETPEIAATPTKEKKSMLRAIFGQEATPVVQPRTDIAHVEVEEGEVIVQNPIHDVKVTDQLRDMGPLQALLEDDSINDILVNGPNHVFVERAGILQPTDVKFKNDEEVLEIAEKICLAVGREMQTTRPLMDARLLDGSRVNIIAPPLAVDGTTISIRKFPKHKLTLQRMVESRNISEGLAEFLKVCGKCRVNVIISGGTGSGKTTMLNAISQFISPTERIVTIEEAAELQLHQPHVVRLETQPASRSRAKDDEVSVRDLVRNALRMRPDRIIVGEVRGAEAFDMMQAMNTGHEGSLATIHANHPRDALSRLENMLSMANLHIPMKAMRFQIASSLHLVLQISRMRDGHRRITSISEIVGMEGDVISMHDLFTFNIKGEDEKGVLYGTWDWTGIMPRFVRRVMYYGEKERLERALGVKIPDRL
jgi:pilus assembly protein CpaF